MNFDREFRVAISWKLNCSLSECNCGSGQRPQNGVHCASDIVRLRMADLVLPRCQYRCQGEAACIMEWSSLVRSFFALRPLRLILPSLLAVALYLGVARPSTPQTHAARRVIPIQQTFRWMLVWAAFEKRGTCQNHLH